MFKGLNISFLVIKLNEEYFIISLLALEDGTTFNIIVKDKDIADKIAPMNKYIINLSLSSSQYGLKLDIVQVVKALGSIID